MELPNARQEELLAETPWDILVVLDACRADYFQIVCGDCEEVVTPGRNTPAWLAHGVANLFATRGATYFTANPIVEQQDEIGHHRLKLVSLWEKYWGKWGVYDLPTVHPASAIAAYLSMADQYPRPHVLHLMQPHAPYIGRVGLPCICGPKTTAVYFADVPTADECLADGRITFQMMRMAYTENLRLVWQAVQALMAQVSGKVVVTSDHGELLGEYGGLHGHSQLRLYKKPETLLVPWVERDCSPILPDRKERLAALGYI